MCKWLVPCRWSINVMRLRRVSNQGLCFCLSSLVRRSHSTHRIDALTGTSSTCSCCPFLSITASLQMQPPAALGLGDAWIKSLVGKMCRVLTPFSSKHLSMVLSLLSPNRSQAILSSNPSSWAHSTPWWLTWWTSFSRWCLSTVCETPPGCVHSITDHSFLTNVLWTPLRCFLKCHFLLSYFRNMYLPSCFFSFCIYESWNSCGYGC